MTGFSVLHKWKQFFTQGNHPSRWPNSFFSQDIFKWVMLHCITNQIEIASTYAASDRLSNNICVVLNMVLKNSGRCFSTVHLYRNNDSLATILNILSSLKHTWKQVRGFVLRCSRFNFIQNRELLLENQLFIDLQNSRYSLCIIYPTLKYFAGI